jgi:hypothetical protein
VCEIGVSDVREIGVSDVGESFRCDDDWCDGVMMDV